ncbi:MAG: hypothetical protein JNL38_07405 [Myxococcales bacterium]|nr:hypothetical protein [Myxococcales bacterium]
MKHLATASSLLVSLSLSLSLPLVGACGGATDPGSSEPAPSNAPATGAPSAATEPPVAAVCAGGAANDDGALGRAIFRALEPSPAASYLSLRQNLGAVPSPGLRDELAVVEERGALCADATDRAKCAGAYEAARPPIRLGFHHCYTRGDTVGCANDAAGAVALLGEVRSVEGALFVAERAGYAVSCARDITARGAAAPDGSFRLVVGKLRPGGPCGQLHRVSLVVARDGALTELESTLVDARPSCP